MENSLKILINEAIDKIKPELVELSLKIHSNPELAFKEHIAAAALVEFMRKHGFNTEAGTSGLETAFRAEKSFGDGPTIAFLAEYDALPEIGHACGHNLIAIMAVGAAVGLAAAGDCPDKPFKGKVVVLGTPAEEGLGGKIDLVNAGAFNDINYALMIHPSGANLVNRGSTACQHWYISFAGQNCHSSNPQNGINALTALMQTFSNIDTLRTLMPMSANINGIITNGGTASNIITDKACGDFTVRARTLGDLAIVNSYIERAVKAAEVLTEAKATIKREPCYAEMYANRAINAELKINMETLGVEMLEAHNDGKFGSSDIGNVSLVVPAIHSYVEIGANCPAHTIGFTEASKSDYGHEMAIKGAKGLGMTGFDIMTNAELHARINKEFEETVPSYNMEDFK